MLYSVDRDGDAARDAVRGATASYLTAMPDNALSEVYGIQQQLQELVAAGTLARELPAAWLEVADDRGLTLCGFVREGRLTVYTEPCRITG